MKKYNNFLITCVIIIFFFIIGFSFIEKFHGIGRGPGIGPRYMYRHGINPNYRRQFYSYGDYYGDYPINRNVVVSPIQVPVQTVHSYPWYTRLFQGSTCKTGCTGIGNGNWGCQYPGNKMNECPFANDCGGCLGSWWF